MAAAGVHAAAILALIWMAVPRRPDTPSAGMVTVLFGPAATEPLPTTEEVAAATLPSLPARTEMGELIAPGGLSVRALRARRLISSPGATRAGHGRFSPAPSAAEPEKPAAPRLAEADRAPLEPGLLAALETRIHAAVQASLVYPPSARLTRQQGRARVRFEYVSGGVTALSVTQSSRSTLLDRAALDAVGRASMPRPPPALGPRPLTLQVWVDFVLADDE